jgi:class 3 adenylate cyclase
MDAKRQSTGDLSHLGLGGLVIRVGLATGDVHAAVLGTQFPTLTYSGAPIIRAEELESKALPGHALLDSTTTALLSSAVLGGISPSEKEGQPSTWGRKSAVHGLGGLRSAASSNQASVSSVMVDLRQRTRSGRRHLALLNYWGVESYHRRVAAALNGRGAGDDS